MQVVKTIAILVKNGFRAVVRHVDLKHGGLRLQPVIAFYLGDVLCIEHLQLFLSINEVKQLWAFIAHFGDTHRGFTVGQEVNWLWVCVGFVNFRAIINNHLEMDSDLQFSKGPKPVVVALHSPWLKMALW